MEIHYEDDALTITFALSEGNIACLEVANDVIVRIDPVAKKVLGVTILDFSKRAKNGLLTIPGLNDFPMDQYLTQLYKKDVEKILHRSQRLHVETTAIRGDS